MRTPWRAAMRAMPVSTCPSSISASEPAANVGQELLQVALEVVEVQARRHRGAREHQQRLGQEGRVVAPEGHDQQQQEQPDVGIQLADHAEVEEPDLAIRPAQVARVRIGVEEPLAEDLLVVAREQLAGRLVAGLLGRRLAHGDAHHLLHHEQAPRRELRVHARRGEAIEARAAAAGCARCWQPRSRSRALGGATRRGTRTPRADRRCARRQVGCPPCSANSWSSARSSRIWCSARGRCTLSTTCEPSGSVARCTCAIVPAASDWRLDVRERILPGDAELALDHRDDLGLRERRHVVLQLRELGDVLGRQEVGPGREHLPELGERRAELLERHAQPASAIGGRAVIVAQAVAGEDAADLRHPAEQPPARLSDTCGGAAPSETKTTLQRAACDTRLATLSSRNSVRSRMPASDTTIRSQPRSRASRTIAAGPGSSASRSLRTR